MIDTMFDGRSLLSVIVFVVLVHRMLDLFRESIKLCSQDGIKSFQCMRQFSMKAEKKGKKERR